MKILLISLIKDYLRAAKRPKGTIFLRFPSLALANLAALSPDDEIMVVDEQISPIDFNINVDLVAVSLNTSIACRAYEIADEFRKRGVKVVFGGLHPTLMPRESLEHADSIIIGDAENSWQRLLADLKAGKLKPRYISNQEQALNLPSPKWEIFDGMGYVTTNFVETSRGCSHHCGFCSTSPFYHHIHRTRPIKDVIRDVKKVRSFPKKFIFFVDDNIIGHKEHAKRLFKALKPLNIYWISQATIDIAQDEELVKLAAESGCFGLFLGFESLSVANLKDMDKKHNKVREYGKAVELLHKYSIGIEAGFVFGFEHDDKSIFKKTLRFLMDNNIESFLAIYLTPIPGTKMHEILKEQGRITNNDYSKYDFRHIVFQPKKLSTKEIYGGVSWISAQFYSRSAVMKRIFHNLIDILNHPSIRKLLKFIGVVAISLAFRSRIHDLSKIGTFPKSFRNI